MNDFTPVGILKDGVDRIQEALDHLESPVIKAALLKRDRDKYARLVCSLIDVKCAVAAVATVMEREMKEDA
ncbi:hypothetical protein [uncultured Bilophila sp.]|uniref:hypothetical protein n=1 Tax=uncultured Bilophila sp. TaxID=529385 RepID=UPI0025E5F5DD|nr:hypothetical protein [uncultured Bilophila sp.]